jgi:NhaA family Na+:H+ antiporter
MAAAYAGRRRQVNTPWYYLLVAVPLAWTGLFLGGAPPALAPLAIVPFLASRRRDPGFFVDAARHAADPLNRLELVCRHPAQLALFLFGLTNAGVTAASLELGVLALPLAMLLGRPAGLLLGLVIARAMGLHLPVGTDARDLAVLGIATAIGFTMTLFVATAALGPGPLLMELRAGAFLTLVSALAALGSARLLHVGRFSARVAQSA